MFAWWSQNGKISARKTERSFSRASNGACGLSTSEYSRVSVPGDQRSATIISWYAAASSRFSGKPCHFHTIWKLAAGGSSPRQRLIEPCEKSNGPRPPRFNSSTLQKALFFFNSNHWLFCHDFIYPFPYIFLYSPFFSVTFFRCLFPLNYRFI